ncbi:tyrosine-type recombinase/integrase [Sphingobium sp. WW5]|uniref:tyrosine-type recombinase/integrase n=1 Tax=unclassified Sphingobium TaxID=2611147 RepID=UPI003C284B17
MIHFSRVAVQPYASEIFDLIDEDGDIDPYFAAYRAHMQTKGYALATQKKYLQTAACFLDYLVEAGVYGRLTTVSRLNQAIDNYIRIRLNPDAIRRLQPRENDDFAFENWAPAVVEKMGYSAITSASGIAAPINLLLTISNDRQQIEIDKLRQAGVELSGELSSPALKAVFGYNKLPQNQVKALCKGSAFAAFARRAASRPLTRRNGISAPRQSRAREDFLDFPILDLSRILGCATSKRDAALWLLLAGTGIRMSEACGLRWHQIDFAKLEVFVDDPNVIRPNMQVPDDERMRFKGRATARTFFIPFLKAAFFAVLSEYRNEEYVVRSGHDFVFQDIRPGPDMGRPFYKVSDTARIKAFTSAAKRAGIPCKRSGRHWTPHSLRHLYGVYMLNDLPVPGGFGLARPEVMDLMGHLTETATAHYVREKRIILDSKLLFADEYYDSVDEA